MPVYTYQCEECGHEFEKLVSFSQAELMPECPHCHSAETHKKLSLVSAFGFSSASGGTTSAGSCGSHGGHFS